MKGVKPISTVGDLMMYLQACRSDAKVFLMPEDGDGFPIGGVLEFNNENPPQVWLLIDEFSEIEVNIPDEQAIVERPGDTGMVFEEEPKPEPKPDVVRIRGKLRSA